MLLGINPYKQAKELKRRAFLCQLNRLITIMSNGLGHLLPPSIGAIPSVITITFAFVQKLMLIHSISKQ